MITRHSWLPLWVLASLGINIRADVIVETAAGFKPVRIYDDDSARFGDALPESGLVGYIIKAEPELGCQPIKPPPVDASHLPLGVHWIAIIRRSESVDSEEAQCTFEDKVKNAMRANYSAAIIYNYKSDDLIPMGGASDDVIPSVFIGYTDATRLLRDYTYYTGGQQFVIRITDNQPFDINAYLLPFAIVVGICFLIMLAIMIFKCIQDRRRERRHRLPKSSLKKIPTKKFVAGDEVRWETCCICLDDYAVGDLLRILPCNHAYHKKCIDPWLLKNKRVCPQCRKKVFAAGEVPPSDSESETEDERRPLLARPARQTVPSGTFSVQRENPFRRAARRLQERRRRRDRRQQEEEEDSEGATSSDTEEEGPGGSHRVIGNQLLAEVHIEQPTVQRSESPTFARVASSQSEEEEPLVIRDMEEEAEVEDSDSEDNTSRDTSVTVIV